MSAECGVRSAEWMIGRAPAYMYELTGGERVRNVELTGARQQELRALERV
jgi:hypothetical protein